MIHLSFVNIVNCHPTVPPSITDEPTEIVVTRLSPVVIACTASGVPEPTIHWSKDGTKLPKEGQGYSILPAGQNHTRATLSNHTNMKWKMYLFNCH